MEFCTRRRLDLFAVKWRVNPGGAIAGLVRPGKDLPQSSAKFHPYKGFAALLTSSLTRRVAASVAGTPTKPAPGRANRKWYKGSRLPTLLSTQNAVAQAPTGERDILTTTLANGVKVITEAMPHVRSVSVGIWISSGSRRETAEENGISHFIEHMLFKGTANRSAEDIARSVDSIGGNLDAFTAKEMVCFNTKVLDEHLPIAMDVLSALELNPAFRDEDIEKEKGVILEEIKMDADSPDYLVHEIFSSNFWKDQPLGKPILGTRETVKRFNRAMVQDYYRGVYTPSNLLITAAGNLGHERLVNLARERFEALPSALRPRRPNPH